MGPCRCVRVTTASCYVCALAFWSHYVCLQELSRAWTRLCTHTVTTRRLAEHRRVKDSLSASAAPVVGRGFCLMLGSGYAVPSALTICGVVMVLHVCVCQSWKHRLQTERRCGANALWGRRSQPTCAANSITCRWHDTSVHDWSDCLVRLTS